MVKFPNSSLNIPEGGILFVFLFETDMPQIWNWNHLGNKYIHLTPSEPPNHVVWRKIRPFILKNQKHVKGSRHELGVFVNQFSWTNSLFQPLDLSSCSSFQVFLFSEQRFSSSKTMIVDLTKILKSYFFLVGGSIFCSNQTSWFQFVVAWKPKSIHRWTQGAWRSLGIDYKCHVIRCRLVHILDPY